MCNWSILFLVIGKETWCCVTPLFKILQLLSISPRIEAKSSRRLTRHPVFISPCYNLCSGCSLLGMFFPLLTLSFPSNQLKSFFLKEAYLDPLPHPCYPDPIYPAFLSVIFDTFTLMYNSFILFIVYHLAPFSKM